MDGSRKWSWVVPGILLALPGAAAARATDVALESVHSRVGTVTAQSVAPDGSYQEETGNCLLWTVDGNVYTLADLHTVMTGDEAASDRVADRIVVKVGKRSSRARLVWPPEGQRNVLKIDMAILEVVDGIVGQPFEPEAFQGAAGDLPGVLFLAAPGHRSKIVPIEAKAVKYGPQWFLYRELSHGDSGGMVFAVENGQVIPYGFVSSIGSLPGNSARGTVVWGRDAMRIFINQFLRAGRRIASKP
jgi:hypothetical protein